MNEDEDVKEDERPKELAPIEVFFEKDLPKIDLETNPLGKIKGKSASLIF